MSQKTLKVMSWIATCTAMLMYISYFPQIMNNIHGNKTGFLQPMVAAINCILWISYGFFQEKKDWPIIVSNIPGVVFGVIAAITSL
nr:SemiSWEET family transporter [uncultured Peptostreptococcus sp.]